jgi:hypothetical protein
MRGAVAGGVVWAAPAVTSVGGAAFAVSPGDQDISFVAILANCGGTIFRFKFEAPFAAGSIAPSECGSTFQVDGCADQLPGATSEACPPGVTATFNSGTGALTVSLGTCTLVDFVVKCGVPSDPADQGCEDPNQVTQPNIGQQGNVTFLPCSIG